MPALRVDPPSDVAGPTRTSSERAVLSFAVATSADLSAGADASLLWRTLRAAAGDACRRLGPEVARNGVAPFDLEANIAVICAAVRQVVRGREPRIRDIPITIPARRCIDELRRSFVARVRHAGREADRDAVLELLEAFERVREALEQDCAPRTIAQLSGGNALDLLVEVVHDMRSPLGSILFLVETLRRGQSGSVNAVQERQLGLVYNAAFGLNSMTSDLTELARGCDRLVDARPAAFSVAEVLRTVGDIVQPIAEEKRLTVEMRLPESGFRMGHAIALHRVLLNLTTNALKFTSDGGVEIAVHKTGKSVLRFSVSDTGRGIPSEVLGTLFDAFRCRQTSGEYVFSSAGLGLAICRKLIEAMGGELRVESAPVRGTRFSFELDLPPASM